MNRVCSAVSLVLLLAASSFAAPFSLYSIGPDSTMSGPSGFYSISPGGTATLQYDLGDGSLGFSGLTYHPGSSLFYAVATDMFGESSLVSFPVGGGGSFTTIGSLGTGFTSGLTYSSGDGLFYGISTDWLGASTLHQITSAGAVTALGLIGTGFYGGLTFRPSDGLLYTFADSGGAQMHFHSITPTAAPTVTPLFLLGDGSRSFSGGLAFDPLDSTRLYVISSDWLGSSRLHSFTLAGPGSLADIADLVPGGFINAGMEAAPPIPEPSTWLTVALGLLIGVAARLRQRA